MVTAFISQNLRAPPVAQANAMQGTVSVWVGPLLLNAPTHLVWLGAHAQAFEFGRHRYLHQH